MTDQAVPDAPPEATELAASIDAALDRLAATFASGRTRDIAWRQDQLDSLARLLELEADRLGAALTADLGKPPVEGWITDIASTATEVAALRKGVAKWARPERRRLGLPLKPSRGEVIPEPLGTVLVLAPWNYPVQLIVAPLAAAIAAGNVVVAKPSELAPATSAALAELLPRYLDPAAVAVVEGGPEVAEALLERRFDHILFTGSTRIGRVVMEAAARHLTPVTLELGGKSPVVVDASADLDVAARRIAWGKSLNAGQTCVAPDYVLVERSVRDRLVDGIAARWREFYGDDPQASADYGRIVADRHVSRLAGLLVDTEVAVGGRIDLGDRYVEPTLVVDPDPDSALMTEEIFGPILPVIAYDSLDEAIAIITGRSKPLALYVFSSDDDVVERVLAETSAGGVCVNNVVVHVGSPELPFGGVGDSGMGRYHGRAGFDAMSNPKAVLRSPTRPDLPVLYPPYNRWKEKLLRRVAG